MKRTPKYPQFYPAHFEEQFVDLWPQAIVFWLYVLAQCERLRTGIVSLNTKIIGALYMEGGDVSVANEMLQHFVNNGWLVQVNPPDGSLYEVEDPLCKRLALASESAPEKKPRKRSKRKKPIPRRFEMAPPPERGSAPASLGGLEQ
jgi:hypothetical protein